MNIFDIELNTPRIKLRRICYDDLTDMFEFTSNPSVTKYLEWESHNDIVQTQEFIKKTVDAYTSMESSFSWGIEYISNSKFIGVIRIYDYISNYGRAEISYIINPDYQGQGIMTEAVLKIFSYCFNKLNLVRIQAKCSTLNENSIKLLQKTGMTREGCLRKYFKLRGVYQDSYLYAIISDDFVHRLNGI